MSRLRYRCLVLDHDDTVMDSTRLIHHPAFLVYLSEMRPGVTVSLEEYFRLNFHPGFLEYCRRFAEAVLYRSFIGFQQSQGNTQQCGLSHTGRAHQRNPLSGGKGQIHILQNRCRSVGMGYFL